MPTRKTRPVTRPSGTAPVAASALPVETPSIDGAPPATATADELLVRAVEEAARLLDADGAMVYLLDRESGLLRFAHEAGIRSERSRQWVTGLELPVGTGLFGRAVAERTVVKTDDYSDDPSFRHASATDRVVDDVGIRSMVAAPLLSGDEVFGALGTFSTRPEAFDPAQIALVRALADHAAAAMANARLIEALDRSRRELAQRADVERSLREIAARISSALDLDAVLQRTVDEATRLIGADAAILDVLDPDTNILHWSFDCGLSETFTPEERADLWIELGVGATGRALAENRVMVAGDDLVAEFPASPQSDLFFGRTGFRSLIAAPIAGEGGRLGVLEVYAGRPDAFSEADGDLIQALASHAAIAITNARLIEELARSREEQAHAAEAERALREIAARMTAMRDQNEILKVINDEAARLLRGTGSMINLTGSSELTDAWVHFRDRPRIADRKHLIDEVQLEEDAGVSGLAYRTRQVVWTDDYMLDDRFRHMPERDAFVRAARIRSVISAPLVRNDEVLGVLTVYADEPSAFGAKDAALLGALADQGAVTIVNARLIGELERSREEVARRADAERTLREIAARITAIRDTGDLLQHVVDEAARLLRADGAMIDVFDPETETLACGYDAGLPDEHREAVRNTHLAIGEGVSGKSLAERRVIVVDDYAGGSDFVRNPNADQLAHASGIRSLIAAPIITDDGPLGAIEVFRHVPGAFDAFDAAVLGGLADQAAVAMTNARLIAELARSRAEVEHRAERERSLRDITARITSLRDPREVLERVVEEAKRLLGSDGAHLTRMAEAGTYLVPVVVAGGDPETAEWIKTQEFPIGGGINGLAAERVEIVWTRDYLVDERIPLEEDDIVAAERLGLRAMAAAPLRAPAGGVIGTLAISYRAPRAIEDEELDLLQGLADQAAIAIANSNLLERQTESERRYRHLVQNSPDLVWSIGPDARLTFVSDTCERLTGWRPDELLGRHFGALVHASSRDVAEIDWARDFTSPSQELRGRVNLLHRDGSALPAEFTAMATLDAEGRFAGANGSVRDMAETDRLERELRESENRYRDLASSSPDMVFATDPEGRYTFVSDAATKILGWDRDAVIGRSFTEFVPAHALPLATASYEALVGEPDRVHHSRMPFRHADGHEVPLDINVVGSLEDGRLVGIHGVARDVSDRERLERELRESEARFRQLVQTTPDVIWRVGPDGRCTFIADSVEALVGWRSDEIIGQPFMTLLDEVSVPAAIENWERSKLEPDVVRHVQYVLRRKDGSTFRAEISAVGLIENGVFVGGQGTVRDISERDRLERELRRQAGELASSEERAHLARELHDSVTQALFSMTLVARSVELLLERDPEAARTQLAQLRELQREALAEMRALIFELRPGNVEQDGLARALRTHSAALQGRIGLPIVVESEIDERLPLEIEETLYRIAQEALHNVVKHAAARQVRLAIHRVRRGVALRIEDDGKGFDPDAVPDGHLGIAGMRARAAKIDAELECRSQVGRGTTIEVLVPNAVIARFPASSRPTSKTPSVR